MECGLALYNKHRAHENCSAAARRRKSSHRDNRYHHQSRKDDGSGQDAADHPHTPFHVDNDFERMFRLTVLVDSVGSSPVILDTCSTTYVYTVLIFIRESWERKGHYMYKNEIIYSCCSSRRAL